MVPSPRINQYRSRGHGWHLTLLAPQTPCHVKDTVTQRAALPIWLLLVWVYNVTDGSAGAVLTQCWLSNQIAKQFPDNKLICRKLTKGKLLSHPFLHAASTEVPTQAVPGSYHAQHKINWARCPALSKANSTVDPWQPAASLHILHVLLPFEPLKPCKLQAGRLKRPADVHL